MDNKEEVSQVCEDDDDDDDPENRYIENKLHRYSRLGIKAIDQELRLYQLGSTTNIFLVLHAGFYKNCQSHRAVLTV